MHHHEQRIDEALIARILASPGFVRSDRMCRFLRLLAERAGQGERVKETEIGVLVFDREVGYDPKLDSIVRTEATRLRRKLAEYYVKEGSADPIQFQLPPGRYELEIVPCPERDPAPVPAQPATAMPVDVSVRRPMWHWLLPAALLPIIILLVWRLGTGPAASPALGTVPFTYFEGSEAEPAFSP